MRFWIMQPSIRFDKLKSALGHNMLSLNGDAPL